MTLQHTEDPIQQQEGGSTNEVAQIQKEFSDEIRDLRVAHVQEQGQNQLE